MQPELEPEPLPPGDPLRTLPNTVLTPADVSPPRSRGSTRD